MLPPTQSLLDGQGLTLGLVASRFNPEVCQTLLTACLDQLHHLGVNTRDITVVRVAGALEIPLILQQLAQTERYHACIALGAVIRGETYHFEVVANEAISGVSRVSLDYSLPIANGILTTYTEEQALARSAEKGRDCAQVAIEMARLLQTFKVKHP